MDETIESKAGGWWLPSKYANSGKVIVLFHVQTCTCQLTVLGKESLK